jgi:uncharacterized protein YabE (DUF348 family)
MRRGVRYAVSTTIVVGLLGAGAVLTWTALDKKISVQIDGASPRYVHTMASDVRGALTDSGYPLGGHDQVTPAANHSVHEGTAISVVRGRMVTLTVDGTPDNVWVAASTVGEALAQLGFQPDVYASRPDGDALPVTPSALTVRTAKSVTLIRAGKSDSIESTAPSVGALLAEQGITVGPQDILSVPASTVVTDLMTITWKQVRHQTVTEQQPIDYATSWQDDPTLAQGASTVAVAGQEGVRTVTFDLLTADGQQIRRTALSSVVSSAPIDRIVNVGTKVPVVAKPATSRPTKAAASAPASTPVAKPAAKPAVKPAAKPAAKPVAKPAAKPVAKPAAKPVARKPAPKPITKPVVRKPVAKPAPKPVVRHPAPKPAPKPVRPPTTAIVVTPGSAQAIAKSMMTAYGWNTTTQFSCLVRLWNGESGWRWNATNRSSGAYGIPQSLPANKMASAGADWRTNPRTQIRWGMGYLKGRYGTPCSALSAWLRRSPHWY